MRMRDISKWCSSNRIQTMARGLTRKVWQILLRSLGVVEQTSYKISQSKRGQYVVKRSKQYQGVNPTGPQGRKVMES